MVLDRAVRARLPLKARSPDLSNHYSDTIMSETVVDLAPSISHVEAIDGNALLLRFATGEVRRVDWLPFLSKGVFRRLEDEAAFKRDRPINNGGGIGWEAGADLSRDTLYVTGKSV